MGERILLLLPMTSCRSGRSLTNSGKSLCLGQLGDRFRQNSTESVAAVAVTLGVVLESFWSSFGVVSVEMRTSQ